MVRRRRVPKSIRLAVLTESGYRCAVPTCRTILAIDLHHIVQVSDGGSDEAVNLLALCPTCHALHHRGEFPSESIRAWKKALTTAYPGPRTTPPPPNEAPLRVLYFHAAPRCDGLDYLRCPRLVRELERRGHELRFCWAVHEGPLVNNVKGIGRDLMSPESVREWRPGALVFEDGMFVGTGKISEALLDELETAGAVAVIEIPPHEYRSDRERYDRFLGARSVQVEPPHRDELPVCKSTEDRHLVTTVEELRDYSVLKTPSLFSGVRSLTASSATPLRVWHGSLVVGGQHVYVKAYGSPIHLETRPVYGVLIDHGWRTEAIFLAHLLYDSQEMGDNAVYLANLLECLHESRTRSLVQGADLTRSTQSQGSTFEGLPNTRWSRRRRRDRERRGSARTLG